VVGLISEKLSGTYTKIEDKYFDLLDALDDKGLPVYAYSDFFEEKGIPSLIVTIAIIFLLLLVVGLAISGPAMGSGEYTLILKDNITGQPITNATVTFFDKDNVQLKKITASDGDKVILPTYAQGTTIKILVEKSGYDNKQDEFLINENAQERKIYLSKDFVGIDAKLRLTHIETGAPINSATVTARYGDVVYTFFVDSNGLYAKSSIPEGETLLLNIKADGYAEYEAQVSFFKDSIKDFTLTPGTDSFVGLAKLVITVSDEEGNSIDGATVKIYNTQNQAVLLNTISNQGAVSGSIQTQIPLKIIIEKEGYLLYDSDVTLGGITIVESEKRLDLTLMQGGEELIVNVITNLGLNLSNAIVQIFDEKGNKIARSISTNNGAEFFGLKADQTITITAYREGYLPLQTKAYVGNTETVPIILKEALSGNSFRLDLFTIDALGDVVPGTNILVNVFTEDGNKIPYGFEDLRTSVAGYSSIVVDLEKNYEIIAETQIMQGDKIIEVNSNTPDNKVYITMVKKDNVVELKLVDLLGGAVYGNATISTLQEEVLFDGNIENSSIFFNATDKDIVLLKIETADGLSYSEEIFVKNKETIELTVYDKENSDLSPLIEFIGIETENGEDTKGITPGAFYLAKFSITWPLASNKGGVHIRTGSDAIEFSDSENIAIFDLSLNDATKFFSYSYNPSPSPGDESLDRSNQGYFDEPNKWVEGTIDEPKGTYIAKVKIRASEFSAGKVSLKYRAWSEVDNLIYRMPMDAELEDDSYTENKASLYADTEKIDLTLYESLPECNDNVCVSYNFVDEEGNYFDLINFEALKDKVYALETEFTAIDTDYLQLNVTTDSNMSFLGTQTSNFKFLQDSQYLNSKEASTPISLTANGKQKIRVYFIPRASGTNIINLTALGNSEITKDIAFEAVETKEMLIEFTEKKIPLGRDISLKVLEQNLTGIQSALIKVINKQGEVVKSVVGDGREDFGKNGKYKIVNDLEQGVYTIEISANKYQTKTDAILISAQNVLSLEQDIEVKMKLNEKKKIVTLPLTNNSSFDIKNLSITSNSEKFSITANILPLLGKNSNQNIALNIEYIGDTNEANETSTINVKGMIEGKFLTGASTSITMSYNQKQDMSCLKLTPNKVKIAMVGNAGASTTETIEVKNDCEETITLSAIPIEKTRRSNIKVTSENISLSSGRTQIVTISASNFVDRVFNRNESYNFEIRYESNLVTKTLPITVELINPQISLSYPGQVTLYLAQDKVGAKAVASRPIFVTNVSGYPVEGIKFSQTQEYASTSNVSIRIVPPETVSLQAGQSMQPKLLFAEASTRFSEPVQTQVRITGKLGDLDNRVNSRDNYNYQDFVNGTNPLNTYRSSNTGYTNSSDLLGTINVLVYYSGFDCLKASLDTTAFYLSAEGVGRASKLTMTNNCAEPVRLLDIQTSYPGLIFSVPNIIVGPNQVVETQMMLGVMGSTTKLTNFPITIRGLTEGSQTVIETKSIPVDVYAGVNYNEEHSKADDGISAKTCEGEEITISIPREASNGDCANGYCDGEEAAEYVAKKLDVAIKRANAQAYSAQKGDQQDICNSKGFCTLGDIGIQKTSFDLYLKNDTIGRDALRDAFAKYGKSTQGVTGLGSGDYLFDTGKISVQTLAGIARSGIGRHVIIDDALVGCGYYNLVIDGVFPVTPQGVNFLRPTLTVQVQPIIGDGRVTTKECTESIENISNFTPIDKSYKIGKTGGTLLTTIQADKSLIDMAKKLSEKISGSDKRFGVGNGNKIILKEAALGGTLAEVCLLKGETAIVEVKINSGLSTQNETTQEGFEQEVVKLISNAINGNFGENCLTKSSDKYNCVKLRDLSGLGDGPVMKLTKTNLNMTKTGGCISGSISSRYPETMEFLFQKLEKNKDFTNITEITVSENKIGGEVYFKTNTTGKNAVNTTVNKMILEQRTDNKDVRFTKDIKICAKSGEEEYLHTQGVQFILKAINKSAGKRETAEKDGTITIITESIHPDDLGSILANKANRSMIVNRGEEHPYYFTIAWKGKPETIQNFNQYYSGLDETGKTNNLTSTPSGGVGSSQKDSDAQSEIAKKGINSYLMSCSIASMACNMAGGAIIDSAFGALFDCGIPALTIFSSEARETYKWLDTFYTTGAKSPLFGSIFEFPKKFGDPKQWNSFDVNPGTIGGATLGAGQQAISKIARYGFQDNYGRINTAAISDFATVEYADSFKTNLTEVIRTNIVAPVDQTKFINDSTSFIKSKHSEVLTRKVKESTKVWNATGRKYTLDSKQMTEIMQQTSEDVREAFVNEYLQGAPKNSTTKRISSLIGGSDFTESEFNNLFKRQGKLRNVANQVNTSTIVKSKVSASMKDVSGDMLANLTEANAKTELDIIINEITRDSIADYAAKKGIDITDNIDDLVEVATKNIDSGTFLAQVKKEAITNPGNGIKYSAVIKDVGDLEALQTIMNSSPGNKATVNEILTRSMGNKISTAVDNTITSNPALRNITESQLDNLTKAIDDIVSKNPKKVKITKKGISAKVGELLRSPKFYRSLALGAGCGVISNMVGIKFSNNITDAATRELQNNADDIPVKLLTNGLTYRMIIETKLGGKTSESTGIKALIEEVSLDDPKDLERMTKELSGKDPIKGTTLAWTEKMNKLQPQERILNEMKLSTSVAAFRKELKGTAMDKEDRTKIINILTTSLAQKVIYRYSNTDGKEPIKIQDEKIVLESWVGGIIAIDDYTDGDLTREYEGKSKTIKERVEKLVTTMNETKAAGITPEIAREMYPDKKDADNFFTLISAWEASYGSNGLEE
jgi:hypothetical protein